MLCRRVSASCLARLSRTLELLLFSSAINITRNLDISRRSPSWYVTSILANLSLASKNEWLSHWLKLPSGWNVIGILLYATHLWIGPLNLQLTYLEPAALSSSCFSLFLADIVSMSSHLSALLEQLSSGFLLETFAEARIYKRKNVYARNQAIDQVLRKKYKKHDKPLLISEQFPR